MTIEEILAGESENIEFKRERPADAKKYLKSVVAFANGHGGRIIFGVEDKTLKVTGISDEILFKEMDAIANTISDSCEPRIIPDISLQEIDGKTLIVVEIAPGMQRPYYIKSMGMQEGTFIRVAGTSRPVEPYTLRELLLDGSGRSFDSIPLEDQTVSISEIEQVCLDMTEYAKSRCRTEKERSNVRPLTKNQLMSWELIIERNGKLVPTYGFCLLAGKSIPSVMSSVQCAVFKGTTRAVFVDRRQYDGPIYRQIDDAYDFVLRMIRLGAKIDGIVRQDVYEFPVGTVREMICNAVCHRSYLQPSNVQVALYDDRLEVTSPGMLSRDMTIERMKEGYSKIRNRGIASAFLYLKIIEGWGSGIPRMIEECKEYGLKEPELIDAGGDFRINLYRKYDVGSVMTTDVTPIVMESESAGECRRVPESAGECRRVPESAGLLSEQQARIYNFLISEGQITSAQTERLLGVKQRRARTILSGMVKANMIDKVGTAKNTKYVLKEQKIGGGKL
ncbi:ATP-binding protein [Eisenbergiella tayi]|uniref:ATP-binding protein n=1 Tax=Eisenbergiella tayi TaxID=1432052 RepID=UPI00242DC1B7|nr:ATP-binding protein [Eisenbergiella tayi]